MNCEGPYFGEGFEMVAVSECYLITNHVRNIKEAAVPNMPQQEVLEESIRILIYQTEQTYVKQT